MVNQQLASMVCSTFEYGFALGGAAGIRTGGRGSPVHGFAAERQKRSAFANSMAGSICTSSGIVYVSESY